LEATLECSATVLAASMVTVIGVMTQMWVGSLRLIQNKIQSMQKI
jgi:hypothetical protein